MTSDPIGLDGGLNSYGYADANPINKFDPLGLFAQLCSEDKEKQCDKQYYDVDIPTCRAISKRRGKEAGERCYASASRRYAACLRGDPIPDLDTYNNRTPIEPPPATPPTVPTPPWWMIPLIPFLIPFTS